MQELTQARLKELLSYDPDTGIFVWLINRPPYVSINSIAGSLNDRGYRHISIQGKKYKAHRLAWLYIYGKFPDGDIDHINRDRDDNRIANLRDTTRSVNLQNCTINKTNTSGVKGVSWDKRRQKWQAWVKINTAQKFLGYFKIIEEAKAAREKAEKEYYSLPD